MGELTLKGYGNKELEVQPIFRLETSGGDDVLIKTDPKLDETWSDIVEVACNSFNPEQPTTTTTTTPTAFTSTRQISPVRTTARLVSNPEELTTTRKLDLVEIDGNSTL